MSGKRAGHSRVSGKSLLRDVPRSPSEEEPGTEFAVGRLSTRLAENGVGRHNGPSRLVGRPPARLTSEQAAWVLNCRPHDVPILVAARLLKPLGDPEPNSVKYFATVDLLELADNRVWLGKATAAMSRHW